MRGEKKLIKIKFNTCNKNSCWKMGLNTLNIIFKIKKTKRISQTSSFAFIKRVEINELHFPALTHTNIHTIIIVCLCNYCNILCLRPQPEQICTMFPFVYFDIICISFVNPFCHFVSQFD